LQGANQGSLTEGEGFSTIDLLVLVSLNRLLLMMQTLFTFFTKQARLIEVLDTNAGKQLS
jgi:hypothetical protein